MYLLTGINTKCILNVPKEKSFAPLRILNLFIKSLFNPFVAFALTFYRSFNSFLFDVTSFSLLSKSVLFRKLAISFLLPKFAYVNLVPKISAINLLYSGAVIIYHNYD